MKFLKNVFDSPRRLSAISWGLTALIVFSLLGFAFWKINLPGDNPSSDSIPTTDGGVTVSLPGLDGSKVDGKAILRLVALKTSFDQNVRYEVTEYTVGRGDTISSIAEDFSIKSSSLMWANAELMENGPNSLSVGQLLLVPPVDGVLHQWEEGDTLDAVAEEFQVVSEDILFWPGNNIDLADPVIADGAYIMIPGGKSDAIQWTSPVIASGASGTSGGNATPCGGEGPAGGGGTLLWPSPYHYINGGNVYSGTHLAIDLYAPEGSLITAADHGVVVWSSYGAWNGGYGNVVMIDHRNGFATLYGHLSQVNVGLCQAVYAGSVIGLSGNTGNSFGAHLHFEVRYGGGYLNPWDYLPPP